MVIEKEIGQPLPEGGWSHEIQHLPNARIVPPVESSFVQEAGVFDAQGNYIPEGALWRRHRALLTEPPFASHPQQKLSGKWLWGGVLWMHFGHFLTESVGRLWPYHDLADDIEGVIFIPKRPRLKDIELASYQTAFFDLMGMDKPVKVLQSPTEVEELIMPGQGFGLGPISDGIPAFRNMIHDHFAHDVAPDGPERLYISRTALNKRLGGVLGEGRIEEKMRAEGYEVFYPELHSLEVQVARYKAAKQIVGLDGSAFHIAAMVARPEQQIGMILRREDGAVKFLEMHIQSFVGKPAALLSALKTEWVTEKKPKPNRNSLGEPDFEALGKMLWEQGFISDTHLWQPLDDNERRMLWDEADLPYGKGYIEYTPEFRDHIAEIRAQRKIYRAEREARKEMRQRRRAARES